MPSNEYNTGIYASVRQTVAQVWFDMVAPDAKEKATVSLPNSNEFSKPRQIIDNVTDMGSRMATFEPDYWKLDGSFALPKHPGDTEFQVGWWGGKMSGADCVLDPVPTITVTFSQIQSMSAIGIAFDEAADQYSTDFEVSAYTTGGGLIYSERISDNLNSYAQTSRGVENVAKIIIKLYKTNHPYRYPRITELTFGFRLRFDGGNIISLSLITEADPMGKAVPYPQLVTTVKNDGRFNHLAPDSYSKYLYRRQAFEYRHGLKLPGGSIEWVYCGVYYLTDWDVSDDEVNFTAVGRLADLERITYYNSGSETMSIGALAKKLLDYCGFDYEIATFLFDSPPVCAYFGEVDCRSALAMLANLSSCLIFEDRQNTIRFTDVFENQSVDRLDYNNMFSSPSVGLTEYYNGIILREYVQDSGEDSGSFKNSETFYPAPWHDPKEPYYGYSLDLPMMITNKNPQYQVLKEWVLSRKFALLEKRLTANISWRQNPAQEIGDIVDVQIGRKNEFLRMAPFSERLEYSGGVLKGSTKAIGGLSD